MMDTLQSQIQAFKLLHGLETLPASGEDARKLWAPFSQYLLSTVRLTPHLEQLVNTSYESNKLHQHPYSSSSTHNYKEHFINLSTGIRLHYLSWPHTSDDVILLLHDIANCAESWITLGTKLYNRGYTVFALDLRGHGGTAPSPSNNYSANHLAEDVNAFIVAKDLYIRPVAVVGCGIGGAVALTLANKAPNLVGAVACIDFGLPPALLDADFNSNTSNSSAEILPWWSFWLGQGLQFESPAQCAGFLMSPLTQVGPALSSSLLSSTTHEDTDGIKRILDILNRPPAAAAQHAVSMLRSVRETATSNSNFAYKERFVDEIPKVEVKMDPHFFFKFDIDAMKRGISALKLHLLVIHGERSAMVASDDAATLVQLATPTAASVTIVEIPQTGHYLVQDAPDDVYTALVEFSEGPAVTCFNIEGLHLSNNTREISVENKFDKPGASDGCSSSNFSKSSTRNSRRPEVLGIRPLPEYASLEEAKKALGPRKIPTAEAIEEELKKLRLEEKMAGLGQGAGSVCSSDDEEEGCDESRKDERKRKTALSQDPSDYFGFVG